MSKVKTKNAGTGVSAGGTGGLSMEEQPRNARIINLLLHSMGVDEYDARVPSQLLEFMHRYTNDVFTDAQTYAEHAGRTEVSLDDCKLAIQAKVNHSFTTPPPRQVVMDLASQRNSLPLPKIRETKGIHLPPEKFRLTQPNYAVLPDKDSVSHVSSTSSLAAKTGTPIARPPPVSSAPRPLAPPAPPPAKVSRPRDEDDYDNDEPSSSSSTTTTTPAEKRQRTA